MTSMVKIGIYFLYFSGPTCERRIKNIPFKPLSERMMEEPFWLGLLAVFIVLGILGTGYLLKKHLPEKFDKLLTEGPDGNKSKKGRGTAAGGLTGNIKSFMLSVKDVNLDSFAILRNSV